MGHGEVVVFEQLHLLCGQQPSYNGLGISHGQAAIKTHCPHWFPFWMLAVLIFCTLSDWQFPIYTIDLDHNRYCKYHLRNLTIGQPTAVKCPRSVPRVMLSSIGAVRPVCLSNAWIGPSGSVGGRCGPKSSLGHSLLEALPCQSQSELGKGTSAVFGLRVLVTYPCSTMTSSSLGVTTTKLTTAQFHPVSKKEMVGLVLLIF